MGSWVRAPRESLIGNAVRKGCVFVLLHDREDIEEGSGKLCAAGALFRRITLYFKGILSVLQDDVDNRIHVGDVYLVVIVDVGATQVSARIGIA